MQRICRFKTNINRDVFREIEAHFDKETVWEHNIITQDWSTYLLRRSSPTVPASVLWHLTGQRKGDSRGLLLAPVLTSMYVCQHDANSKQADTGNLHLSDESFSIYHHFSNNLLYNFDQSEIRCIAINHAQSCNRYLEDFISRCTSRIKHPTTAHSDASLSAKSLTCTQCLQWSFLFFNFWGNIIEKDYFQI